MLTATRALVAGAGIIVLASCSSEPPQATSIPALDDPYGAVCEQNYPDGLASFPVAFAGTIVQEKEGKLKPTEDREAKMKPMEVTFEVNEDFTGALNGAKKVTVFTYDYNADTANSSHIGEHFLMATQHTLDVALCGFTRPDNAQDREYWSATFG